MYTHLLTSTYNEQIIITSFAATRCSFREDDAELSSYLQEQFAGLLQAPFLERVQAIITSTLSHPTAPLEGDPLMVDTMMDVLRNKPGWALWKSCCPLFLGYPTPPSRNALDRPWLCGSHQWACIRWCHLLRPTGLHGPGSSH